MSRSRMRRTPLAAPLALLTAALLAVACDAPEPEPVEEAADEVEAPAPPSPSETAGTTLAPDDPPPGMEPVPELAADTVQVTLREGSIEMPETLPPGRTVFRIHNEGGMDHTVEIAFESAEARLDPPAAPGETKSLVFTMSRGSWEFYCPIGNHREQGEEAHVTVGG